MEVFFKYLFAIIPVEDKSILVMWLFNFKISFNGSIAPSANFLDGRRRSHLLGTKTSKIEYVIKFF